MKKCRILLIVLATVAITACATTDSDNGLLESMPSGYDIYLTFDPDGIAIDSILAGLAATSLIREDDLDQVREDLGFLPLDWSGWTEALALVPGKKIGLIVDNCSRDASLICLYVPTSDQAAVRGFFTRLVELSDDFKGELKFMEKDGYSIVLVARTADIAAAFTPDAAALLGSDPDLSRLAGDRVSKASDVSLFIRFSELIEDSVLHSTFFEMQVEGSELEVRLAVYTVNHEAVQYSSILESPSSSVSFRVPENISGVLRFSLGMETLTELVSEEGIDREFETGIEEFGFNSFIDLLNSFSGDVCLLYGTDEEQYTAAIQFGLGDPRAIANFLVLLQSMLDGTEGSEVLEFDLDGETCYRIEIPLIPGMKMMEYGVVNDILMISGGCSLKDLAEGKEFGDYIREHGMGISPDNGMVLTANTELINDIIGFASEAADPGDAESSGLNRVAGSLNIEEGLFRIVAVLEVTEGNPSLIVADLLITIGLDIMARPIMSIGSPGTSPL